MYSISPNICTELLVILDYLPPNEKILIPKDFIEYLTENKDISYNFIFHGEIPFDKQDVSVETKAIIVALFKNFFSNSQFDEEVDFLIYRNTYDSKQ